jgi:hypothetical protein
MVGLTGNRAIGAVADEASARLRRVCRALSTALPR